MTEQRKNENRLQRNRRHLRDNIGKKVFATFMDGEELMHQESSVLRCVDETENAGNPGYYLESGRQIPVRGVKFVNLYQGDMEVDINYLNGRGWLVR